MGSQRITIGIVEGETGGDKTDTTVTEIIGKSPSAEATYLKMSLRVRKTTTTKKSKRRGKTLNIF